MASLSPTPGRCGAKIRNSLAQYGEQRYCDNYPEFQRDRCKFHGGACLRGIEHPRFRGRGYSKDIPANLAAKVAAGLEDQELISLGAEIALLDGRIGTIFEKMQAMESEYAFDVLQDSIYKIEAALISDEVDNAMEAIKNAKKAIKASIAEREGWGEILAIIKERRQLVDTERKREEMLQGNMNARQVATFVAALQMAILEEVPDAHIRQRLGIRLAFLMGLSDVKPMNEQRFPGYNSENQVLVNVNRQEYLDTLPPSSRHPSSQE